MKTSFGYVRVSTVKQGDGVSLEAQRDAILAFASRNNIDVVRWFEEKETAAKRGRPVFNKMVSELKQRKARGVIFHKIDRSARNFADWARISDLAESGIDVHFTTESLDFRSRGGRLTADIQAVIAADYIRNLRDETIKGLEGRLKQGLFPFKAPLGYLDNGRGKVKTIDPVRGPLVRKLFELYATGNYSLYSLTDEINRLGLRNCEGRPVAKTGVEKILRNPFYVGLMEIAATGKSYPGIHKPLITMELFDAVTCVRTGRDNKKSTKHNRLFRGMFHCGHCQTAMIPELQKGRVYYRCHVSGCETKTVREDVLEVAVRGHLTGATLRPEQAEVVRQKFLVWLRSMESDESIEAAEFELRKIDERMSRLADKFIDGAFDDQMFQAKKNDLTRDRLRWEEIARNRRNREHQIDNLERFLELATRLVFLYDSVDPMQKRELLNFASSNRSVYGKNIAIEPSIGVSAARKLLFDDNVTHLDPVLELLRRGTSLECREGYLDHSRNPYTDRAKSISESEAA